MNNIPISWSLFDSHHGRRSQKGRCFVCLTYWQRDTRCHFRDRQIRISSHCRKMTDSTNISLGVAKDGKITAEIMQNNEYFRQFSDEFWGPFLVLNELTGIPQKNYRQTYWIGQTVHSHALCGRIPPLKLRAPLNIFWPLHFCFPITHLWH